MKFAGKPPPLYVMRVSTTFFENFLRTFFPEQILIREHKETWHGKENGSFL